MTTTMVQPGMSRIPRAAGLPPKHPTTDHRRTSSAPSKLEQLQAEYQQRLLREKEQKLIEMYERNTQLAMQKTNVHNMHNRNRNATPPSNFGLPPPGGVRKAGSVRDFFNHRRNNENGWVNNNNEYWKTESMRSPGAPRKPMVAPHIGRDKSQPLAPLQQTNGQPNIEQRRYRPHPPTQPNAQRQPGFAADDAADYNSANGRSRPAPPAKDPLPAIQPSQQNGKISNFRKWKQEQNAKYQDEDNPVEIRETPQNNDKKISEFQKWQQEQDQQRAERIKKYKEKQQNSGSAKYSPEQRKKFLQQKNRKGSFMQYSDEEDRGGEEKKPQNTRRGSSRVEQDDAAKKKKEMEDMIAKEKAELIQMQKKKQKDDAQREREKERKRQVAQEERLRKMREKEEEQQRQEEIKEIERQRQEAQKRQREAKAKAAKRKPQPAPPPPPDDDDGPEPPKIDNTAFYEQLAAGAGFEQVDLSECSICGRKFATDRLDKHITICAKSSNKKRKVFDPVKMRTEGTEQAQYNKGSQRKQPEPQPKKNNWRKKHEDFIKMMQYNKKLAAIEASGGNPADLPPPPRSENPDYVQCPTCSRKFNPTAAERHIPRCKDMKTRPPPQTRR